MVLFFPLEAVLYFYNKITICLRLWVFLCGFYGVLLLAVLILVFALLSTFLIINSVFWGLGFEHSWVSKALILVEQTLFCFYIDTIDFTLLAILRHLETL